MINDPKTHLHFLFVSAEQRAMMAQTLGMTPALTLPLTLTLPTNPKPTLILTLTLTLFLYRATCNDGANVRDDS